MAKSPEYPDLLWVPPRSYTKGRTSKGVRLLVVHHTAGSERPTSAEDGAAYDARRLDGTSTHYFIDSNSVVQCVRTTDMAHTARRHGNQIGIQYEFCGTLQTRAQWLDPASRPTIRNAARQMARDAKKYGIPIVKLTTAQTRQAYYGNVKGICGHAECTKAFPEDNGDHMDPGPNFPYDVLLADIKEFMGEDEDEMTPAQAAQLDVLAWRMDAIINMRPTVIGGPTRGEKAPGTLGGIIPWVNPAIKARMVELGWSADGYSMATLEQYIFEASRNPNIEKKLDLVLASMLEGNTDRDALAAQLAAIDEADKARDTALAMQVARTPEQTVELLIGSTDSAEELAAIMKRGMNEEQLQQFKDAIAAA
jgi:hypothetical protein